MKTSLTKHGLLLFAFCALNFAQPLSLYAIEYRPAMTLGLEGGGDRVFERGVDTGGTRGFNAGALAVLGFGVDFSYPVGDINLNTRTLFGFKAAGAEADDGKLDFFRWIVELSEHYRLVSLPIILGGGLTYHFSNALNATGVLADLKAKVDPSLGYFLQADYAFRRTEGRFGLGVDEVQVGLRFTAQNYQTEDNTKYNGNAFGVHFRSVW